MLLDPLQEILDNGVGPLTIDLAGIVFPLLKPFELNLSLRLTNSAVTMFPVQPYEQE